MRNTVQIDNRILSRLAMLLVMFVPACSAPSLLVEKPQSEEVNGAVTAMWQREIGQMARSGDWILTRSYSLVGDIIVTLTPGEGLSHASIYDAERKTVIEALTPEVREVPLANLLERNMIVIVVRPSGLSPEEHRKAVERARSAVGSRFDFSGLFGIQSDERFYCSELVFWASEMESHGVPRPLVVTPPSLMGYGDIIYVSGSRNNPEVQEVAVAAWRSERQPVARAW